MLVADTSAIFAALDRSDADHDTCGALLSSGDVVVIPAPVVFEVDWLSRARGVPEASTHLLASVVDGSVLIVDLDRDDYQRVAELLRRYRDLPLDAVDAAVVAVAERLEQDVIATLDRRHFSVVRPVHVTAFTLLPARP